MTRKRRSNQSRVENTTVDVKSTTPSAENEKKSGHPVVAAALWFVRVVIGVVVPATVVLMTGMSILPAISAQLIVSAQLTSESAMATQITYWLAPFIFFIVLGIIATVRFCSWFWKGCKTVEARLYAKMVVALEGRAVKKREHVTAKDKKKDADGASDERDKEQS